jgi:hypothetical protein
VREDLSHDGRVDDESEDRHDASDATSAAGDVDLEREPEQLGPWAWAIE